MWLRIPGRGAVCGMLDLTGIYQSSGELLRVRQDRLHRENKHGAKDEVLTAYEDHSFRKL